MLKRIHINQHNIRHNLKTGDKKPVVTVKGYKQNRKCDEAVIKDAEGNVVFRVVYRPDKPLGCGARVWIETELEVEAVSHERR